MDMENLRNKYVTDLEKNFLPFWEAAIDEQYGGVFSCFTNKGDTLVSERKYTWSQGRFLWMCCKLQALDAQGTISLSKKWKNAADHTYQFLNDHALMENNHAVFAVERDGEKIEDQMDTSIFADCFYVLGCNAYAQLNKDVEILEHTLTVYRTIKSRIEKDDFSTAPYPIPTGYRSHSIPMILSNVAQELYDTTSLLDHASKGEIQQDVSGFLNEILGELSNDNRIFEMFTTDSSQHQTLLARHVNPGHTLESAWFMIHSMDQLTEEKDSLSRLARICSNALSLGWDDEYGGLLRFVDKDGGKPQGDMTDTNFESLIRDTWDTKLWWPHSEALYTTLLLHEKTGDPEWLTWYEKLDQYIFDTFPNEDQEIGEWVQIRNREGKPLEKVVALPVKDPFHIVRNFILIIDLLEESY